MCSARISADDVAKRELALDEVNEMSKRELKRHLVGQLNIPDGLVDITDPCYDKDVWCRMNDVRVMPGKYNCYAYMGTDRSWGNRCWIAQIVIADGPYDEIAEDKICSGRSWRIIGSIGVDAGMAGFFNHKPDFDDKEWSKVCETRCVSNACKAYMENFAKGFWTDSGIGDGCYTVHAIREDRKIIALEIRF